MLNYTRLLCISIFFFSIFSYGFQWSVREPQPHSPQAEGQVNQAATAVEAEAPRPEAQEEGAPRQGEGG